MECKNNNNANDDEIKTSHTYEAADKYQVFVSAEVCNFDLAS